MGNSIFLGLETLSPRGKHKRKQYEVVTGSDSINSSCESPKTNSMGSEPDTPRVLVQFENIPSESKEKSSHSSPSYEVGYVVEYPDSIMYPPRRIYCSKSNLDI